MKMRLMMLAVGYLALTGCATVHQEDLDPWAGVPVVRTKAADGTEMRRYINGRNVASCSGGGSVFANTGVDMATYNTFSNCMQGFAACNSIFYIKDGRVQQVTLIGTGGARCYSNESLRPGFRGSVNI